MARKGAFNPKNTPFLPDNLSAFGQWQQDKQSLGALLGANGKQSPANSQIANDIQNIGAALQSGNVTEAQKALAQLKIDMQAACGDPSQRRFFKKT